MKQLFKGVMRLEGGTVINVKELPGFSMPGEEDVYISRNVIDPENCGAKKVQINHGTVKAGKTLAGGSHREPYDEIYYVVRGNARLRLGEEEIEVGPDTAVYIPAGAFHQLDNSDGSEDLEIITVWSLPIEEGVNALYDARKRAWGGSSFKRIDE
jgi:mannose-6-phosphate isomerase-like protein (cupin superfamily)